MNKKMNRMMAMGLLVLSIACGTAGPEQNGEVPASATVVPAVPLQVAVIQGNLAAIQQHIDAGTNLDEPEPSRGSSALITAATFGKTDIVQALVDGGADVNLQNNEGSTALITAAFFCREDIVQILLDNGADKTIQNNAGRTALDAVSGPYEQKKPIYDALSASLGKFGLQLDEEHLKAMRPIIAEMLVAPVEKE